MWLFIDEFELDTEKSASYAFSTQTFFWKFFLIFFLQPMVPVWAGLTPGGH